MNQVNHAPDLLPEVHGGDAAGTPGLPEPRSLRQSVEAAVNNYFEQLDGQMVTDVYDMVLAEVEAPLLEDVLRYTRNNQTLAATVLGLNRGTLRKKLKQLRDAVTMKDTPDTVAVRRALISVSDKTGMVRIRARARGARRGDPLDRRHPQAARRPAASRCARCRTTPASRR